MTVSPISLPVPERVPRILPGHLTPGALSVVVYGPGRGEAVVVFLPDGTVGVVDGCREPERGNEEGTGDPVRELLNEYEKSAPGFRIRFVCLTHPHDDHYAGLGRLMTAYGERIERAWETLPVAGRYQSQLVEYVKNSNVRPGAVPEDEQELRGLERVFDAFRRFLETRRVDYDQVERNKTLLDEAILGHRVSIVGWAAHAADIRSAVEDFGLVVEAVARDGVVRAHDPNRMSGALSISWGKAGVLLAGDALREQGRHVGWRGAHELAKKHPIQVVSVAHHASEAAHDEHLWSTMAPHLAIVTPFRDAEGDMPPRPEQIAQLVATCTVAITSPPSWPKPARSPRPVMGRAVRKLSSKVGLRAAPADPSRHAVAVSLDEEGRIVRLILAEGADIYR